MIKLACFAHIYASNFRGLVEAKEPPCRRPCNRCATL